MSITWNGVSSDTIGVIVEKIPNRYVPTRRFSPQQVAGRNGNILLVDKSFPNVEQEYEVYLSAEAQGLPSVARACAEWLMGPDGYCRLEDSYDTTVYREAFLMGGYDLENILNKFGRCTITFSCKPQKYLLTGDTPIEIPAGTTTYTGDVVQFDGVTGASITSLSTTITPTQDLHGYSSPWPAGGGKNKYNPDEAQNNKWINSTTGLIENTNGYWVTGYIPVTTGDVVRCQTKGSTRNAWYNTDKSQATYVAYSGGGNGITAPSDGFIVLTVGASAIPFGSDFIVTLNDADLTYAPYSNICPITGRTGLSVYRTGKNLADVSNAANATNVVDSVDADGKIHFNDVTARWSSTYIGKMFVKAGETYTLSGGIAYGRIGFSTNTSYPQNGVNIPDITVLGGGSASSFLTKGRTVNSFTANYTGYMYAFYCSDTHYAEAHGEFSCYVFCNVGSTASTYEPYNGTTYAVDWTSEAGTVYGGTLDVVTGVLTVDRANIASYNGEVINEPWLSSMDAYVEGATPTTGAQVVYTLATPLTYQLTPQEIEVLVGENNVWTSSGPVSVTVEAPFVGTVTNPTPFEARPMLEVSGLGEITINGKSIQILEAVSDFQIDCEAMEAEDNSKIYCMDFPELSGGVNEIAGDGSITALTVTPRWWTL